MQGKVAKYERDNIDTDVIIPGTYLKIHDPDELASHAMEGLDPKFHERMKNNSILVTGKNFGCGSSREHAPIALSRSGVKAILAPSFARIFYRNCVDGAYLLPVEISNEAYIAIKNGDELGIEMEKSRVYNITQNTEYEIAPVSDIITGIIKAGGLFRYKVE